LDALPGLSVDRASVLVLIVLASALPGCMDVERPCPENTCFPLTSSAFNSFLEEAGEIDALELASQFDKLAVSTITRFTESDVDGEMVWRIEKDDSTKIRQVANSLSLGGSKVVGYEIWDGGRNTFTRTSGEWMIGRDMEPNYEDPFVEIARLASENPESRWPPFRFDVSQFSGMSWTITGDALESYQIARAANGTHEIYFELHGLTPQIVGITVYSGGLEQQDVTFGMSISTDYWDSGLTTYYYTEYLEGGKYLELNGMSEFAKSPVPFIPVPQYQNETDGQTIVEGIVPSEMTHEASLSEIEMHVFSEGSSVATLLLSEGSSSNTTEGGDRWELSWADNSGPGLLSEGDHFSVSTNSEASFDIRIFDRWAQTWTDQGQ
jgi:hypothetical protein